MDQSGPECFPTKLEPIALVREAMSGILYSLRSKSRLSEKKLNLGWQRILVSLSELTSPDFGNLSDLGQYN